MKLHIVLLTSLSVASIYAADTPSSDPKSSQILEPSTEKITVALVNTPNNSGITPLHLATYCTKVMSVEQRNNAIRLLIQNGAAVNALDKDGNTPLHFCAACGAAPETVSLLKSFGADHTLTNNKGYTPLLSAIEHGYIQYIESYLHSHPVHNQSQSDPRSETKG